MKNTHSILQRDVVFSRGDIPYVTAATGNNGVMAYVRCPKEWLEDGNCIMIGGKTLTFTYQEQDFCSNDSHNIVLYLKDTAHAKKRVYLFIMSALKASFRNRYTWGHSISMNRIQKEYVCLPCRTRCSLPDFEWMERFIARWEEMFLGKLNNYLSREGLADAHLSEIEESAWKEHGSRPFADFCLSDLFGSATRGKRLKSEDRIPGSLPFVTAGEAEEGVSAFIGNEVAVFPRNTITIDMFGSAKYRNFAYGCDDHAAVIHTEKLPQRAVLYLTAAIHKAAHDGTFSYARNFYAKDADALHIMLPVTKKGDPDYEYMSTVISAVQKMTLRSVMKYRNQKMQALQQC